MDKNFFNNIILTRTEGLTINPDIKDLRYSRNKNILVIGGSGSGKTRNFVIPNILQMNSSYIISDPKGEILSKTGALLENNGYIIKVLNTVNFKKTNKYNPFEYIKSEKDILKLVNVLITNTSSGSKEPGRSEDDFWVKAERLLYQAYIGYIFYEGRDSDKNFDTLVKMINSSATKDNNDNVRNQIDDLFDDLERKYPNHFAVRQYKMYKLAAGKTAKSVLISCAARLASFSIKEIRDTLCEDEMELDKIGDRKTAVFVILSDTDDSFNFIAAMLYSQIFNILCDKADSNKSGMLDIPVRCILDEFANIGQIPKFDKLIATIRSRNISASIILQTKSQLKAIYKDAAETIIGNCDSFIFLGGKDQSTLKEVEEILGTQTITYINESESRSNSKSFSINKNKTGRKLLTLDELMTLDGRKCILHIRGLRAFLSDKYILEEHPRYSELENYMNRDCISLKSKNIKINKMTQIIPI